MKWFGSKRELAATSSTSPVAGPVTASGVGSVAVNAAGGHVGAIQTGANSVIVNMPPETLRPAAQVDAPPGIDNLPVVPGRFVGREHELDRLDTLLSSDAGQVVVSAVHGLGGIGKSSLVAYWAATRPHGHSPILWITADTAPALEQGLAKFAAALQSGLARDLSVEDLTERALQWLASHTGWLLILDNVNDPRDITAVLARALTGRVIVTSRLATGWAPGASTLRVDVLEPEESLRLLIGIITADGSRNCDGGTELCQELGHLPLAVEQAGAYLAQNRFITPREYLHMFAQYPTQMYEQGSVGIGPQRTIARIWRITLDQVATTTPAAADLLHSLAWYAPDDIPLSLCQGLADPLTLGAALGTLAAYGLITPDPDSGTLSIHRLVQAVNRSSDPTDPHRTSEAIERARTRATTTLRAALPDRQDPFTWPVWRALLPHIDAFATHTGPDITSTEILNLTALFLNDQGVSGRAIALHERTLADSERILGVDHPETLSSRNDLANAYQTVGRDEEAVALHERTLADRERVLGVDHPETLISRNDLANAYQTVGRDEEAVALHERTLADSERVLGDDHPATLSSRNNFANAYRVVGRVGEAIALHERTLADRERILGVDHPDTLTSRNNLANAYQTVGRDEEAVALHERTLADRERVLGVDHPETLGSRNNLANAYQTVGRDEEAVALHERTLADSERVLGDDHPATLSSRNNFANAYRVVGRVGEAIALHERTLADRERILGVDHPDTLTSRNNLANAYQTVGRDEEAVALHERTLADRERVLSVDHPDTLTSRNNLANTYQTVGRNSEAVALHERTLADSERVRGDDHPETLTSRNNLANAYRTVGRVSEAIALHERSLADREQVLGDDHPETLRSRNDLANAYQTVGRDGEAVALHERTLADRERVLGVDHPATLRSRNNLANAYQTVGRVSEAIALHERTLADSERVRGADDSRTVTFRDDLARARRSEAEKY
ncbi:FxSxx-COOH system tetratricopeptide repeat protein [Nocardia sp. NPDC057227]|uniref:FxSxx-COOH system tetratricopeptide repeat protein n=1 Tax=Nocardia sp. NPDC057227 TaxID=3346056 RepID=UPI0036310C48